MKLHKLVTALILAVLALPLSAGAAAHRTAPLKVGDKGWKVKTVQIKLNAIGMKTPQTGKYTRELEGQVRNFQKEHRLPATGKVDDTTYFRIQEAASKKRASMESGAKTWSGRPPGTRVCLQLRGNHAPGFRLLRYVQYVFRQHRAQLPRTADLQYEKGLFVTQRQLKPGDLVFFSTYERSVPCGHLCRKRAVLERHLFPGSAAVQPVR